jgi:phosphoglycerol transferase MdoB-like AlkP superfamily enzyme
MNAIQINIILSVVTVIQPHRLVLFFVIFVNFTVNNMIIHKLLINNIYTKLNIYSKLKILVISLYISFPISVLICFILLGNFIEWRKRRKQKEKESDSSTFF